jgi:hypothetical protein
MKTIIIFILLTLKIFGCTGDCMTCHPSLLKHINTDTKHKPMLTCIKCHSPNPSKMADCGSDCFACHSVNKIEKANVKEHFVIRECRDCHMKIDSKFELNITNINQTTSPTLRDYLQP